VNRTPDYYALLHVHPDAPPEIIRASYRTLMQKLGAHPDLGGDHGYAQLINEAYRVLKDPARREAYDRAQGHRRAPPPAGDPEATTQIHDTGMYRTVSETGTWAGPMSPSIRILERCAFCDTEVPSGSLLPATHCRSCDSPLTVAEQKVLDASSRRAMRRIERNEPVRYRTDWRQRGAFQGRLVDLSLSGMRIRIERELSVHTVIAVDCAACECVGRVAHAAAAADGHGYSVGIEFLTLDFKQRKGSLFTAPA